MIELRAGSATDVGLVRTNNQDELLVAAPLFAVADGMGGAAAGEVASATAIQALHEAFSEAGAATPEALSDSAKAANRAVWQQAETDPEMHGMGTTLVALARVDGDRLAVINVGDSRLYQFHNDELQQITVDHNLVAELVAEGRLSREEAEVHPRRNIMTRALGVDPEVQVDLFILDAEPGDRFLLCSDGLPRELRDEYIASLLRRLADPQEAARELVNEAKQRGGTDNITAVVVDIVSPGDKEEALTTAIPTVTPPEPQERKPKRSVSSRLITVRVVGFLALLLLLLALAGAGIGWYARAGYYVGLTGDRITIFQGRPGGLLWFRPTVALETSNTTADVEPRHLSALSSGQEEPSLTAARQFVASMIAEKQNAQAAAQ